VRAVASFYDMLHLEPVGRHMVEVCTNVSCALVGAQQVLERFEQELGSPPARRPRTASDAAADRVPRRLRLGDDRLDRPPLPHARASRTTSGRSCRSCAVATELVLADARERDLTKLAEYEAVGGYTALAKARGMARRR
jgi:hypothetical protein